MIIFLFITQNYKITYFSNKPYFYHFFFKKKKIKKKKEINDEKERLRNFYCICCRFNKNLPLNTSDIVYLEWAIFKREKDREVRLGTNTSIREMYSCQTFLNLFCKWLEGDVGKNFKHKIQLVACYVTKLELSWTADDWRLVDDLNTKLITCEKSGRCKIKFIVIC